MRRTLSLLMIYLSLAASSAPAVLPAEVDGQPLPSLAPILEQVTPAVVNVHTRTRVQVRSSPFFDDPFFRHFFDFPSMPRERVEQSLGSGVIVDAASGYVLTNNHVIDGADDIAVTLQDGREFAAELVGADRDTDLAVIRIDAEDLSALPLFASDTLRVGDFVVAVGNPFGLGQTVTSGIVSALGRSGLRGLEYQNFIQTDASINPGNSGGALIDLAGRLIGINTAIFTPSGGNVGIGFAIPASTAEYVMDQLIRFGEVRRGSLGIDVQELDDRLREALGVSVTAGVVITRLDPESPAGEAGLRAGDVIIGIDGRPVRDLQTLRNIEGLLAIGTEVPVAYLREGRERSTRLRMAENLDARISGLRLDQRLDGLTLVYVQTRRAGGGVGIEAVRRNSPTWRAGLRPGDLIVAMNQRPVSDLRQLRGRFPLDQDKPLMLEILRRGVAYRVMLEP